MADLTVLLADITTLDCDAIVNAANESLLGGGGVDGAIHRAAGPDLLEHCKGLGGCPAGEARITPGFNLRARHIIHTVGPIWRGGHDNEDELLSACYTSSIIHASDAHLSSIAFPSISTGIYGFPPARAAPIAVHAVVNALTQAPSVSEVIFCCFDKAAVDLHEQAIRNVS